MQLFPHADIQVIKDAGRWVHTEEPELFQSMVYKFIKD